MNSLIYLCVLVGGANAALAPYYTGLFGHSGIVNDDGNNVQFTREQAENIVLIGPSGVVTRDGKNYQLRDKRSAGFVNAKGSIGYSGIVRADGTVDQFGHDAHNIVEIGPSGIVFKDGKNVQLTEDLTIVNPRPDAGTPTQFKTAGVSVLLEGPSGIVMSDGTLVQKRAKRSASTYGHLFGDSGIITNKGRLIQLPHGVKVVIAGPSGAVLSNGESILF